MWAEENLMFFIFNRIVYHGYFFPFVPVNPLDKRFLLTTWKGSRETDFPACPRFLVGGYVTRNLALCYSHFVIIIILKFSREKSHDWGCWLPSPKCKITFRNRLLLCFSLAFFFNADYHDIKNSILYHNIIK